MRYLWCTTSGCIITRSDFQLIRYVTLLEAHEIRRAEIGDADVDGFGRWRDQLARVFTRGIRLSSAQP